VRPCDNRREGGGRTSASGCLDLSDPVSLKATIGRFGRAGRVGPTFSTHYSVRDAIIEPLLRRGCVRCLYRCDKCVHVTNSMRYSKQGGEKTTPSPTVHASLLPSPTFALTVLRRDDPLRNAEPFSSCNSPGKRLCTEFYISTSSLYRSPQYASSIPPDSLDPLSTALVAALLTTPRPRHQSGKDNLDSLQSHTSLVPLRRKDNTGRSSSPRCSFDPSR
jgi:hypothetical protein